MSLLQQQSCPKNKTICIPHLLVSIETIINKQTWKKHRKNAFCKDQQITYFLLIKNVPYFEKMSSPFLSNNNNLFPEQ